jgi:hypothetical protein
VRQEQFNLGKEHAGEGYAYDWLRMKQHKLDERKKQAKKLRKRMKKLTKPRK